MNQRQFQKRLKTLHKKHFGKCTYCRKPYTESCHTFSGLDFDERVQDVSYCCKDKLATVLMGGVYVAEDINTPKGVTIQRQLAKSHPYAAIFSNPTGHTEMLEVGDQES